MDQRRRRLWELIERLDNRGRGLVESYGQFTSWSEDDLGQEGRDLQTVAWQLRRGLEDTADRDIRGWAETQAKQLAGYAGLFSISELVACGDAQSPQDAMTNELLSSQALRSLRAQTDAISWLQPDAAMSLLSREALQFIDDRVDEHCAAIDHYAVKDDRLEPIRPHAQIERSLYNVRFRCGYVSWRATQFIVPPRATLRFRWLTALERARKVVLQRCRAQVGSERCAAIFNACDSLMSSHFGRARRADEALRAQSGGFYSEAGATQSVAIGGELFAYEAMVRVIDDPDVPSPWQPLLALWERGVATLPALDGSLLLYVPVYDDRGLVGDPVESDVLASSDVLGARLAATQPGGVSRWRAGLSHCAAGMLMLASERDDPALCANVAALHRFARHGLGPQLSMSQQRIASAVSDPDGLRAPAAMTTFSPRLARELMDAATVDRMMDEIERDRDVIDRASRE